MKRPKLASVTRNDFRKSVTKRIRREGGIPATVYGKGVPSHPIRIEAKDLLAILKSPDGRLSLIDLQIDGKVSKAHPVIIQEIQRDPITSSILHVDFHRVNMNEPIHASVPIMLVGEAPGTHRGGILELVTRELDLRALPDHMPSHIDVDVSHLEISEAIHVGDIQLPEDVELIGPAPDAIVAVVRQPAIHVEVAPPVKEELEEAEEVGTEAESPE